MSLKALDADIKAALAKFKGGTDGAEELLTSAAGALVFPSVVKVGVFGIGGQYGRGGLVINDKIDSHYDTISASFGFQLGVQAYSMIIVFLTDEALKAFQYSNGWEIGVDASVAVINLGMGTKLNTENIKDSVVAFVFDNAGLMYSLALEGTKITKFSK